MALKQTGRPLPSTRLAVHHTPSALVPSQLLCPWQYGYALQEQEHAAKGKGLVLTLQDFSGSGGEPQRCYVVVKAPELVSQLLREVHRWPSKGTGTGWWDKVNAGLLQAWVLSLHQSERCTAAPGSSLARVTSLYEAPVGTGWHAAQNG